jgi:hypothetical protein
MTRYQSVEQAQWMSAFQATEFRLSVDWRCLSSHPERPLSVLNCRSTERRQGPFRDVVCHRAVPARGLLVDALRTLSLPLNLLVPASVMH